MRILVTNDDGVDSPGIHALRGRARRRRPRRVRGRADRRPQRRGRLDRSHDERRPAAGRTAGLGRAARPARARDRRPACDGGLRRLPRRVRRPARPRLLRHQPRQQHRPPGPPLRDRGRRAYRRRLGIPGIAVSIDWSIEGEYHWDVAARLGAAAVEWAAKPDGDAACPQPERTRTSRSPSSRACARRSSRRGRGVGGVGRRVAGRPQDRDHRTRRSCARHRRGARPRRLRHGHAVDEHRARTRAQGAADAIADALGDALA